MTAIISAIGVANPQNKQSQVVAIEMVANALQLKPAERRLLKSVYQSTGIENRYSVISDFCKQRGEYEFFPNDASLPFPTTAARMQLYKRHALDLALAAVTNCLATQPGFAIDSITHVITVSCTGMYAPGLDIELVHKLGLNTNVKRTAINFMGCYGAFNGLKVADAICQANNAAKVLMVSVELCSIHFQKSNSTDSMISNAIFADGAAAVIVETQNPQIKSLSMQGFHCDLLPQHSNDMAWQIADSGFDIVLSAYVPQAIETGIVEFMQRLLQQQSLSLADIDLYAIHPGGKKILKACEQALSITEEDNKYSYDVLKRFGNMSSATVLFVLKAIWDDLSATDNGKTIFSCAFGPGLTLESMLLTANGLA